MPDAPTLPPTGTTTPPPKPAPSGTRPELPPRVREALQASQSPPKPPTPTAQPQTQGAAPAPPRSPAPAPQAVGPPQQAPIAPPAKANADAATTWKAWFNDWPESIPRRGIVVNSLDEAMPFKGFMVRGDTVLLERTNPDTLGARFLLVPFAEVAVVKFVDPLKQALFEDAGFRGRLSG